MEVPLKLAMRSSVVLYSGTLDVWATEAISSTTEAQPKVFLAYTLLESSATFPCVQMVELLIEEFMYPYGRR